jgi:hypothetical protein
MRTAAVLPVVIAALAAASAGAAPASPVLALAGRQPVVVAGAHFRPLEWVRVTVFSAASESVRLRADRRGTFRTGFSDVTVGRCGGMQIRASGTRGSVAVLKLPLPACMPARNP